MVPCPKGDEMLVRTRLTTLALALALPVVVTTQAPGQRPASAPQTTEDRLVAAMHGISSHTILDWVKELASEKYEGRLTGTPSYDASAAWAVDLLKNWTIKPGGDAGTYYQRFPNPYTLVKPGAALSLHVPVPGGGDIVKSYVFEDEYYPGSTSDSSSATAEVVYVGFGITAPELGYDDYQGVDVKGKFVAFEPEVPMGPEPDAGLFKKWRP
jgi:hypothetical protein